MKKRGFIPHLSVRGRTNYSSSNRKGEGFTLIELLVVIAIIGIIAAVVVVYINPARVKARDVKRKFEISQIGKFLTLSCYLPSAGGGEYDLLEIIDELKAKFPQAGSALPLQPKDPKIGTDTESYYRYIVTADGKKCALYANLENENEPVTLKNLTEPTAGGASGVLEASSAGWNGSTKYFQASN